MIRIVAVIVAGLVVGPALAQHQSDATKAWHVCLYSAFAADVANSGNPHASAERAFLSCQTEENFAVLAAMEAVGGLPPGEDASYAIATARMGMKESMIRIYQNATAQ